MDFNFSIDFDAEEVYVVIDNATTLVVTKDDCSYIYKNFEKIEDTLQDKLKQICKILLTLEDE